LNEFEFPKKELSAFCFKLKEMALGFSLTKKIQYSLKIILSLKALLSLGETKVIAFYTAQLKSLLQCGIHI